MRFRYPAVFVNHGGGPLPLLGQDPGIASHLGDVRKTWLPKEPPSSIVVFSAHWESDPIKITSSIKPSLYFDYYGFPKEAYDIKYPVPGSPTVANKIHTLLTQAGIPCEKTDDRGLDHGVFVPLLLMYPEAEIPVVQVSLHSDLSPKSNFELGEALRSLRQENVLFVGSGYTFHNMRAFFNPSEDIRQASIGFNNWLKQAVLGDSRRKELSAWKQAPHAQICHPREEHLVPLFVIAGLAGDEASVKLIYDTDDTFAVSSYMFA